jgi:RNA polymerase primary sigma factor
MREAQRHALLTPAEEIELARAIERGLDGAVRELARWPAGLRRLALELERVKRGQRAIGSIAWTAQGSPDEDAPEDSDADEPADLGRAPSEAEGLEGEGNAPLSTARARADRVLDLLADGGGRGLDVHSEMHEALVALSLRPSFLLELRDGGPGNRAPALFRAATAAMGVARDRMVCSNLRLVMSQAKRYLFTGVPYGDLIQEGNIGLITAAEKFDWRRGFRFSTMATWWIKQAITRGAADKSFAIRLPVHAYDTVQRLVPEREAIDSVIGSPDEEKLAHSGGIPPRKFQAMLRPFSTPVPIAKLDAQPEFSGREAPDAFDGASRGQLEATIRDLLSDLEPKMERVIRLRFGLDSGESMTLEEVGRLFNVTRERVRQIESHALRRLNHPTRRECLAPWSAAWSSAGSRKSGEPESPGSDSGASNATQNGNGPGALMKSDPEPTNMKGAKEQPAPATHQLSASLPSTSLGSRSAELELVAHQATVLGIPVSWGDIGGDRVLSIGILKAHGSAEHELLRALLSMGFAFEPGKGYWR